jgi:hypothetical protein
MQLRIGKGILDHLGTTPLESRNSAREEPLNNIKKDIDETRLVISSGEPHVDHYHMKISPFAAVICLPHVQLQRTELMILSTI